MHGSDGLKQGGPEGNHLRLFFLTPNMCVSYQKLSSSDGFAPCKGSCARTCKALKTLEIKGKKDPSDFSEGFAAIGQNSYYHVMPEQGELEG